MEKQQLKKLFEKYHKGTCTEQEKALLESWYLQYNEHEPVLAPEKIASIAKRIFRELPGNESGFITTGLKLVAAAVTIGAFFMIGFGILAPDRTDKKTIATELILPGSDQATLTLSDGRKIELAKASKGNMANGPGSRVIKTTEGQITYADVASDDKLAGNLNNITIPKGGQWRLTLSDGSMVWLNSGTSMDFPATFKNKDQRIVHLRGEAYFEIAKDRAHPFIVKTEKQDIAVLGTHFNINAYPDEPSVETTLAEGKIEILTKDGSRKILMPGEEASLSGKKLSVTVADLDETLAWKDGYFRFNDEEIRSIMRMLSRWYNVEVTYTPDAPDQRLYGKIARSKNIGQVLKALEATQTVHFKVEGRRIIVMK